MLNKVKLCNFKCFREIELGLSYLNLLSGLNGVGKSSIVQAILLMRQSYEKGFLPDKICLNGDYIQLGTGRDVLYEHAGKGNGLDDEHIYIELSGGGVKQSCRIKYKSDSDILDIIPDEWSKIESYIMNREFEYLNAERISPQSIYPKSSFHVENVKQLGNNGQYTVHYLSKFQDSILPWNSCNSKEKTLKGAVQYWLNEISPNVRMEIQDIDNTDLSKIGYYYLNKVRSNTFRPTNIGFGVSYVLPVVVALLKARPGSLLIIENPEAHLHPKGQRKMGELISLCAENGVQMFIETHSDHVLNGIRISVKNQQLSSNNVRIFFFQKDFSNNAIDHSCQCPKIGNDGKLDYWPEDFFDEWDKALDEII